MEEIICYNFEETSTIPQSKYIFQYVEKRMLTNIPHSHDFFEICYVTKGSCMQIIDGERIPLRENEFSVAIPNVSHYFNSQSADMGLICLSIEKSEFCKMANAFDETLVDYLNGRSECDNFFKYENFSHGFSGKQRLVNQSEIDCKYLLSDFLMNISKYRSEESMNEENGFTRLIHSFPREQILSGGVSELCRLSNYSRSQITRLMKLHFGKTPWEYVHELRMNFANSQLIFTDRSIDGISEECGFETVSHFSQSFKKWAGESPSSVRKKQRVLTV